MGCSFSLSSLLVLLKGKKSKKGEHSIFLMCAAQGGVAQWSIFDVVLKHPFACSFNFNRNPLTDSSYQHMLNVIGQTLSNEGIKKRDAPV